MINYYPLPDIKFNGHCLINKLPESGKIINLYNSYTLDPWSRHLNTDFTLANCFFGTAAENTDPDKYKYVGYGIGFDSRSESSLTDSSVVKNAIIFGAHTSSSVHIDNKKKIS